MAARRLVIVMLILLGVSLVAGTLAPSPVDDADQEEPATPSPPPRAEGEGGRLVEERIDADADGRETIPIRVGDQLALTVRTSEADEVEIPDIGELEFASPLAPARFDLLATEEAIYPIRLVEADRVIGQIEVEPAPDDAHARGLADERPGTPLGERPNEEDE